MWVHCPSDLLLAGAATLWLASVRTANVAAVNDYGLLPALPPAFYLALGLLVVSFVLALTREPRSDLRLWLHVAALVFFVHGTPAVLFPEPWYAWLYKHVGVVSYISAHGSVDGSIDIYQSWPGFFALAAWVDRIGGVSTPLSYAAWAPVYFDFLTAVALSFALRPFTPSPRIRWTAIFLFEAVNWVANDYFSPQGLAFVLALIVLGMLVNWFRDPRPPGWALGIAGRLRRRMTSSASLVDSHPEVADWPVSRLALLLTVNLIFVVVVISHQLTPYMILLQLGTLTVTGTVRPRWLLLLMATITLAFLATRLGIVNSRHYSLIGSLNPFDNTYYNVVGAEQGSAGRLLTAHASRILSEGLWLGAALGAALVLLRRGSVVVSVTMMVGAAVMSLPLMAVPAVIFFGQDYGGEAVFRVFLFSAPWAAFLLACLLVPLTTWSAAHAVMLAGTITVVVALLLPSYYGLASVNIIRPDEVVASRYFEGHAPPGSILVELAPNFPIRLTANYALFNESLEADVPNLIMDPRLQHRAFTKADLATVEDFCAAYTDGGRRHGFLVLSTDQAQYLDEYSFAPRGAIANLDRSLAGSPHWRIFYRNHDVAIYELLEVPP